MSEINLSWTENEYLKASNTLRFVTLQIQRLTDIINSSKEIDAVPDAAWEELDNLTIRRNALLVYINKLLNDRFEFLTCHEQEIKQES